MCLILEVLFVTILGIAEGCHRSSRKLFAIFSTVYSIFCLSCILFPIVFAKVFLDFFFQKAFFGRRNCWNCLFVCLFFPLIFSSLKISQHFYCTFLSTWACCQFESRLNAKSPASESMMLASFSNFPIFSSHFFSQIFLIFILRLSFPSASCRYKPAYRISKTLLFFAFLGAAFLS